MSGNDLTAERTTLGWIGMGMLGMLSPPALILVTAYVGFAAVAREAGFDWIQTSFMTLTVWALPSQIILVGAVNSGIALPAAALAVGLSAIRLMPMTVSLIAEVKTPRTKTARLLLFSHFIAITAWVFAMTRIDQVPRHRRLVYFGSFAATLTLTNTVVVALVFNLMDELPALLTGALAFLTPVYFLISLFHSARDVTGRLALLFGMLCVPPAHWLSPEFDLLIAGIGGGLIAFAVGRSAQRRAGV